MQWLEECNNLTAMSQHFFPSADREQCFVSGQLQPNNPISRQLTQIIGSGLHILPHPTVISCLSCTTYSKINGTSKDVYLPLSKLHSILAIANLLAHNNIAKLLCASKFATVKIECSFEMDK